MFQWFLVARRGPIFPLDMLTEQILNVRDGLAVETLLYGGGLEDSSSPYSHSSESEKSGAGRRARPLLPDEDLARILDTTDRIPAATLYGA